MKDPSKGKAFMRKKNKIRSIKCPNFNLYYKSTIIKSTWYWHTTDPQISGTEWRAQKQMHAHRGKGATAAR